MKRIIVITIAIILLFSVSYAQDNSTAINETITNQTISKETQDIYDSIEKHSVQITSLNPEGAFCTGTILENKVNAKVLTCKHCIVPTEETWADELKALLVITSTKDDLAYLIMNGVYTKKIPAKIAPYRALIEEQVYFYGQPGMITRFSSTGKILRYTDDWGWSVMPVISGCSGSGLFNKNKELVGVVWGKYAEGGQNTIFGIMGGTDIAVFEPTGDVHRFLREIEDLKSIK